MEVLQSSEMVEYVRVYENKKRYLHCSFVLGTSATGGARVLEIPIGNK